MGFVDGLVLRDRADRRGALTAEARPRAGESIVDTLAAIHAVDLDAVGLGDLGRHEGYIARQLKRWYGQWNAVEDARAARRSTRSTTPSQARIPEQGRPTIVHGDYRLDNCMVGDDGDVVAVLDWEICTLGDPLADVGLLQVYWTGPTTTPRLALASATTAAGLPDRARAARPLRRGVAAATCAASTSTSRSRFWKLACILEGVYARYLGGALGARDPARARRRSSVQVDGAARAGRPSARWSGCR